MTYTYCCVYSTRLLMMDRKPVPKHVEFYSKNKIEKLVHLFGFIIRIRTSVSLVSTTGEILSTSVLNAYQQGHFYANTLCHRKQFGPLNADFVSPCLRNTFSFMRTYWMLSWDKETANLIHPTLLILRVLSPRMFKTCWQYSENSTRSFSTAGLWGSQKWIVSACHHV